MNKITLFIVLTFLFLFSFTTPFVVAQNSNTGLKVFGDFFSIMTSGGNEGVNGKAKFPGLNCGVGGAKDGTEECCNTSMTSEISQPDIMKQPIISGTLGIFDILLSNFPIVGALVSYTKNQISTTIDSVNKISTYNKNFNSPCVVGVPSSSGTNCKCEASESASLNRAVGKLCYKYLTDSKELKSCLACAISNGMWTAIGCVPLNLQSFISKFLLSTGIGLGGVVSLLCIIYSAFMMQTSQGNPEKIKKAQENMTSCILGLIMIIFSVFIIRLIGVDILKIPFITP